MINQYFHRDATANYPFVEETVLPFPAGVIADISLTAPASVADLVRLTAVRTGRGFAFVSLERATTAVAHVHVLNPQPYKVYPLTSDDTDVKGWIVFGPAVVETVNQPELDLELDPRCISRTKGVTSGFQLKVNGSTYTMPAILTIRTAGYIKAFISTRSVDESGTPTDRPCLVLQRNDDIIDPTALTSQFISNPLPPLRSLGRAVPDAAGNLNVTLELEEGMLGDAGVYIVSCDNPRVTGLVLCTQTVPGCSDDGLKDGLRYSDCGSGIPLELPFDNLVDPSGYFPPLFDPDQPCENTHCSSI